MVEIDSYITYITNTILFGFVILPRRHALSQASRLFILKWGYPVLRPNLMLPHCAAHNLARFEVHIVIFSGILR